MVFCFACTAIYCTLWIPWLRKPVGIKQVCTSELSVADLWRLLDQAREKRDMDLQGYCHKRGRVLSHGIAGRSYRA